MAGSEQAIIELLQCLPNAVLEDVCENLGLPHSGTKQKLVQRLCAAGVQHKDILVEHLKDALSQRNLTVSGNKAELVHRLIAHAAPQHRPDQASHAGPCPASPPPVERRQSPHARACVAPEPLLCLSYAGLEALCESRGLPHSGTKQKLVDRLVGARVKWQDLPADHLKEILDKLGLSASGTKSELIDRLALQFARCAYTGTLTLEQSDSKDDRGPSKVAAPAGACVAPELLLYLSNTGLEALCESRGLPHSGTKQTLVDRLVGARVKWQDLLVGQPKEILDKRRLGSSGNKAELIAGKVDRLASEYVSPVTLTATTSASPAPTQTAPAFHADHAGPATSSLMPADLLTRPLEHLQELCKSKNLPYSGTKKKLVERLVGAKPQDKILTGDRGTDKPVKMSVGACASNSPTAKVPTDHPLTNAAAVGQQADTSTSKATTNPATTAASKHRKSPNSSKPVRAEHLRLLPLACLQDICAEQHLPHSGDESSTVELLVSHGVRYRDLLVDDLKYILGSLGGKASGGKSRLADLLVACPTQPTSEVAAPAPIAAASTFLPAQGAHTKTGSHAQHDSLTTSSNAGSKCPKSSMVRAILLAEDNGRMTTAQYRRRREKAGFPLMPNQHVCHIIASANGGADHIDNYFVASSQFNYATGSLQDAFMVFIAGLEQAQQAVAVSKTLNGYRGPDALTLFRQGEEQFREFRSRQRERERTHAMKRAAEDNHERRKSSRQDDDSSAEILEIQEIHFIDSD
jgi:hypothetical protein